MKKLFLLLPFMTCFRLSLYAYICSGVTYTSNGATVTLCAEDYNPTTLGIYPTTMNINLPSGVNYAIEGRVELEQVAYSDFIVIQELDANDIVVSELAMYQSTISDNIHLYTRHGTGRIAINIDCYYGATCSTSGFEFTIRPVQTTDADQVYVADRLGIGTNSPSEALDVYGNIKMSNGTRTMLINPYNSQITTNRPTIQFNKPIVTTGEYRSTSNSNLTLSTNTTPRVTILQSNGNVGIGTITPQYKLDVDGDINSSGTISAETIETEEITVSIPSGADFVFNENYELRSLEELQDYIQQNKHLPDIQSEQDMKENGVSINQLQILLLMKIEELTLYIIKQEERIKELEVLLGK